ncbi:MAG: T9SS type A sorting domain-containing protein [Chitinophagaceae bacterium]|nr:MAG: T9SS type A sorting domain-containing protein [Chitinophagaceae bacterium]
MKRYFAALTFLLLFFYGSSQPTNKVYWVGPETGASLSSNNWGTTSGGAGGAFPSNVNYQLIFDGGGVSGKIYTINLNTTTAGYIVVTNNTTLILQGTANNGFVIISTSGYRVEMGSRLVLENNGTGFLHYSISSSTSYNGTIAGELVIKSPSNCVSQACPGAWLNLSGLITPNGTKVLSVTGTLRLEGVRSMTHVSNNGSLAFAAQSNLIVNTDDAEPYTFAFDPTSTVTLSGSAGLAGMVYPNVVYESPLQTGDRTLSSTVNGNLLVKNTGTGLLGVAGTIKGNLQIQGSAAIQSSALTIEKNLELQGGSFDVNGTVSLKGSFSNNGVVKATSPGKIQFNGTTQQAVQAGAIANHPLSFEVNNPSGLLINSDWSLPGHTGSNLQLTNGSIVTGGNVLTVQNPLPGAIIGGTAASHIIGRLRRVTGVAGGNYLFPVDNAAAESANVSVSPVGSSATVYEVSFTRPNPYDRLAVPAGVKNAGNYFWDISRISGTENADLSFIYGANNFNSENANQYSDLRVLHWNGTSWDNLGGSGVNGGIAVANVSSFSPFTFGTVGPYLLPVQLLSFSASIQGATNVLEWTAVQESEGQIYEVERSKEGRLFERIGSITGAKKPGYSYADLTPFQNRSFYRLKQVDKVGKVEYSKVISLSRNIKGKFEVYPNPANSTLHLQVKAEGKQLYILDATGRTVKVVYLNQTGFVSATIDVSGLTKGMYFIKADREVVPFVKQ